MSEEMNLYKRCKNIFKFHGVDMGGGGESAPEVENAIETHGMGWTDTEEKAGFDIQWDGNTEGLESFQELVYKMPDGVYMPNVLDDIIGASVTAITGNDSNTYTIDESYLTSYNDDIYFIQLPHDDEDEPVTFMLVVLNESYLMGTLFPRSIWFTKTDTMYTSRFYKEASTEEVVHQIDQKYIPGGSGGGGSQTVVKITLTENPEGESADSPYIIESDLTTSEIEEAFKSSNVVAWVYLKNYSTGEWIKQYQLNCATCLNLGGDTMVVFTEIMNIGTGANIFTLSVMGEEWTYSVTPIPLS